MHAAQAYMERAEPARAAAEMALFANEGDNAIGGVRKRLLEGGHHFNAAGEDAGEYDEGYVIVTRKARGKILDLSKAVRQATADAIQELRKKKRSTHPYTWGAFVATGDYR